MNNYYETKEKADRAYGKNGELLEKQDFQNRKPSSKTSYTYDAEGNLTRKTSEGKVWEYSYTGGGMLSSVILPDKSEVSFEYDPLGRRIKKESTEKTLHFVWDGDTLLHEWQEDKQSERELESPPETLVTWVYGDGSLVPSAKLTAGGSYSILSDYLGTPEEAYNDKGELVWSASLDIYGRVQEFIGEEDFIPFRHQGQYADLETGLYYNRHRYFDPEAGQYTQLNPIGLEGGNPTLYGYVADLNSEIDPWGLLSASDLFDSSNQELGRWGERVASQFLRRNGYKIIGSIQNASGHGFDLVAINRSTGNLSVIEVKTSRSGPRGMSPDRLSTWVKNNITKITNNTNGRWGSMPQYQIDLMKRVNAAQIKGTLERKLIKVNVDQRSIKLSC